MNSVFYNLQKGYRKNPIVFGMVAIFLFFTIAYAAFQLKLTENASAILPQSEQASDLNEILENINLSERVFFNIYLSDTSQVDENVLIQYSQKLVESLDSSSHIKEIVLGMEHQSVEKVSRYVFANLPFLVDAEDFSYFDTLLFEGRFKSSFKKKYKSLLSPASLFLKELIINDPVGLSIRSLERLREFHIDNEIAMHKGFLFTKDKKHLLFYITPLASSSETDKNAHLSDEIKSQIQKLNEEYDLAVTAEFFGAPLVAAGNAQQIKKDIILTVSMALVLVVLLIAFFYQSKRLYFIIFLPAVFAVLSSMAVLYFLKGEISAIALGLGSVLVGISIDYVLHIFTHYQKTKSIKIVLEDVSEPILISAITTATAFFGLMVVSAPALQDMGLFAGISILFSAVFSLIFIPLFLRKSQCQYINGKVKRNFLQKSVDDISNYPFHGKKYLLIAILIFTPIFYYFSKDVLFLGDMNAINYMDAPTKLAEEHLNEMTRLSQRNIYVVAKAEDLESVLVTNENLEETLHQMDRNLILKYSSITSILPSKERQKEKLKVWNQYWSPEKKTLLLQQLDEIEDQYAFKKGSFQGFRNWFQKEFHEISIEDTKLIREVFLGEFIQGREKEPMAVIQIKTTAENKKKLHQILENHLEDGVFIIDKEYLTTQFVDQLKDDFQKLVGITLLLVFLIIWFSFGRIELALITYLPLVLSWIWTTGLMSIFGLEFNIVNIIISTFIFGLGIDYCIFISRALVQQYKTGEHKLHSFKTSILFSALTSILGVGVLIFAKHPALQSMAFVTVIGLSSVFLLSFTLQPLLFNWLIYIKGQKRRLVPITAQNLAGSIIAILVFSIGSLINTIAGLFLITLTGGKSDRTRILFHQQLYLTSRFMVYIMFNVKKKVLGLDKEKFEKPAVIISNHQSHIDIMLMLMLHPKMILLTNDWVQRNFFYGQIVKMADFYPILDHLHEHVELLRIKMDKGYSIMIFPEGTRSETGRIGRFHKGAFYIAEQLNLDILPILLHGPGDCITKGEPFLKSGRIVLKVGDRIAADDSGFGSGYVERSKGFRKWYQEQYEDMHQQIVGPSYLRKRVDMNYIYKGPVIEWYVKIKMNFEKNYQFFHELIPLKAHIIDLGCGYGMLDYMMALLSNQRSLLGVDYDEDKIQLAQNNTIRSQLRDGQVSFIASDINQWSFQKADVFVMVDVLHYMPEQEQEYVIRQAAKNLNEAGMIIMREADTDLSKKHRGTQFSEWQSTKLLGFNKTKDHKKQLFFGSAEKRKKMLESLGLEVDHIDQTKMNSNVVLVARRKR